MRLIPRTCLEAGLSALLLTAVLAGVSSGSAKSQSPIPLKQWAAKYGSRFDNLMTDSRNLDWLTDSSDPAGDLDQMRLDASVLLKRPAPKGDVKLWHKMVTSYLTLGRTGYTILSNGNSGRIKRYNQLPWQLLL